MTQELLQQRVADGDTAGDGEMGANGTHQLEEAEEARPAAIDFGDPADEMESLAGDKEHIDDRARRDRRHQRHTFGRVGDLAPHLFVERRDKLAFGDIDEIAAVDDLLGERQKIRTDAGELRASRIKADKR